MSPSRDTTTEQPSQSASGDSHEDHEDEPAPPPRDVEAQDVLLIASLLVVFLLESLHFVNHRLLRPIRRTPSSTSWTDLAGHSGIVLELYGLWRVYHSSTSEPVRASKTFDVPTLCIASGVLFSTVHLFSWLLPSFFNFVVNRRIGLLGFAIHLWHVANEAAPPRRRAVSWAFCIGSLAMWACGEKEYKWYLLIASSWMWGMRRVYGDHRQGIGRKEEQPWWSYYAWRVPWFSG